MLPLVEDFHDDGFDLAQPVPLAGVIGRDLSEMSDIDGRTLPGGVVGGQIGVFAGDQKPSKADIRVLDQGQIERQKLKGLQGACVEVGIV